MPSSPAWNALSRSILPVGTGDQAEPGQRTGEDCNLRRHRDDAHRCDHRDCRSRLLTAWPFLVRGTGDGCCQRMLSTSVVNASSLDAGGLEVLAFTLAASDGGDAHGNIAAPAEHRKARTCREAARLGGCRAASIDDDIWMAARTSPRGRQVSDSDHQPFCPAPPGMSSISSPEPASR